MHSGLMLSKHPVRLLLVGEDNTPKLFPSDAFAQENIQITFLNQTKFIFPKVEQEQFDIILCPLSSMHFHASDLLQFLSKHQRKDLVILFPAFDKQIQPNWKEEAIQNGAFDVIGDLQKTEELIWSIKRAIAWKEKSYARISPYEITFLHKLFEEVAHSSSLDTILTLMLDLIISECKADVASFAFYRSNTIWEEPFRKVSHRALLGTNYPQEANLGVLHFSRLAHEYKKQPYIIAHGVMAQSYFLSAPQNSQSLSLIAIPIRSSKKLIASLNVYGCQQPYLLGEFSKKLLLSLAVQAASVIKNFQLHQEITQKETQITKAYHSMDDHLRATIVSFAHALEASDPYTRGHSERVSRYAHVLAQGLGLTDKEQEQVTQAALMHDIGKIGIRSDKLNKPGKLTDEERAMFKTHPAKGKRILDPIPSMRELIPGAFCHHESFDGSGYPQAMMGENIPLIGRIVAIADTYDAMTSDRSYRQALTHQAAIDELQRFSGSQFDPKLVPVFIRLITEYRIQQQEVIHEGLTRFG